MKFDQIPLSGLAAIRKKHTRNGGTHGQTQTKIIVARFRSETKKNFHHDFLPKKEGTALAIKKNNHVHKYVVK
jgi:hypothetical protein